MVNSRLMESRKGKGLICIESELQDDVRFVNGFAVGAAQDSAASSSERSGGALPAADFEQKLDYRTSAWQTTSAKENKARGDEREKN
jgi:hypothetical protein